MFKKLFYIVSAVVILIYIIWGVANVGSAYTIHVSTYIS